MKNIDWLMDNNTDDLMEVLLDLASSPTEADVRVFQTAAGVDGHAANASNGNFEADRSALQHVALQVYALRVYRSYGICDVGPLDAISGLNQPSDIGTSVLLRLRGEVGSLVGDANPSSFRRSKEDAFGRSPTPTGSAGGGGGGGGGQFNNAANLLQPNMNRSTSNSNLAGMNTPSFSAPRSARSASLDEGSSESSSEIRAALFVALKSVRGRSVVVDIIDALQSALRMGVAVSAKMGSLNPIASSAVRNVGIGGNPFGGRLGAPRASTGHLAFAGSSSPSPGSPRQSGGLLKGVLPQSVLHVLLPPAKELVDNGALPSNLSDAELSRQLYTFVCTISDKLRSSNIRRITFVQSGGGIADGASSPPPSSFDIRTAGVHPSKLFTYRNTLDFREDQLLRHIEPPMAHHLELHRLCNYNIQMLDTSNRVVRAYYATPKPPERVGNTPSTNGPCAFFVRVLVRRLEVRMVPVMTRRSKPSGTTSSTATSDLTAKIGAPGSGKGTGEMETTIVGAER